MSCTTIPSDLLGVPTATLQAWLLAAQTALQTLAIGGQPVEVSYSQGEGSRTVRYTAANMAALRVRIRDLQMALGTMDSRRAIPVGFSQ